MERPGDHLNEQELSDYLDGCVEFAARRRIRGHLDACAGCAADLAGLAGTVDLLRQLPELTPPRDFCIGPRRRRTPSVAARLYPWTRVLSVVAAAFCVVMLVLDILAAPEGMPQAKVSLATPAVTEASPTATSVPQNVAAVPAADTERPTPLPGTAETPTKNVGALSVGTMEPLPTPAAKPTLKPTVAPTVVRIEAPVSAPEPRETRWLWEGLALGLAVVFALATILLRRQARASGAI